MSTALVLGASGYLGRYLVAELAARGYRVRALVRSKERAEAPGPHGAPALAGLVDEWVVGDIRDPQISRGLSEGACHVFSALGVTHQKASPWEIDFLGNLAVLRDAEEQGVETFSYASALGVEEGLTAVKRCKYAFEEVLLRSRVKGYISRPSGYFSDLSAIFGMAQKGRVLQIGEGTHRMNPIHGADLAAFMVDHLEGAPAVYPVGGPEVFYAHEIPELAFEVLGTTPRTHTVPFGVAEGAVKVVSKLKPSFQDTGKFILSTMSKDAVGETTGSRTLREYFLELAGA